MDKKHIYIADDDDAIREAIKIFLENDGYVVTAFANGDALLAHFLQCECDLVILDVMMPGSDGFTVCRRLRERSTVPIIMLTARDSDFDYAKGISLGSDDYLVKPFSPMALTLRVKAIFRRIAYEQQGLHARQSAQQLVCGDVTIDSGAKKAFRDGRELGLTPNEFELLAYLAARPEHAVSRDELLRQVWGYETHIETRATDDTVRRLRKKLEGSRLRIDAVWGFGFRLTVAESAT
ncbi:MAG: response regulator transcription factor [Clostridia bacterium]|nr:response regulator transcription factor [Clostridia bacterium]